jgi:hypothetical protein
VLKGTFPVDSAGVPIAPDPAANPTGWGAQRTAGGGKVWEVWVDCVPGS